MAVNYQRNFDAPVAEAVSNGRFNFGVYNQALNRVNLIDAKQPNGALFPIPKYLRLKEWQAFQLGNHQYFIMVAIYNAKTMAIAQFIVYDIANNTKTKYEQKLPLWAVHPVPSLYGTTSWYESKAFTLKAHNDWANGTVTIEVQTNNFGGLPDLKGQFTGYFTAGKVQPQTVVLPFATNRGMYSQKCLAHMDGSLTMGDTQLTFDQRDSHIIMDDHKGYYPYVMHYDWVTGAGHNTQQQLIGFNLTDNQIINKERYNENCLWVDDAITLLPPVKVTRPNGVKGDWLIKDELGRVDLVFSPVVNTRVDINALVIRSDYHGPYGYFKGHILNSDGQPVSLDGIFGMGEQFYLRA